MLGDVFRARVKAREFVGIKGWINSRPLKIDSLKGKVVLLDFWTYTCINCIRTLSYLQSWHEKYRDKGLVVIGVHTPEFEFEKKAPNIKEAVKRFGITYPVALDSEMKTWREYDNHYWPAKYLIDKDGFICYVHFGEGNYGQTEMAIQMQLGIKKKLEKDDFQGYMFDQSPETYAGFGKNFGLGSGLVCDEQGCNVYVDPGSHAMNVIYPEGQWVQEKEFIELKKAPGRVSYRFNAREANVVLAPVGKPVEAAVFMDGKKKHVFLVDKAKMYNVFKDKKYGDHELSIVFAGRVRAYVFTFG
ncbi:MAG: redoxin domain-containing protein [Candidatus Micrarchaeota archaeon]